MKTIFKFINRFFVTLWFVVIAPVDAAEEGFQYDAFTVQDPRLIEIRLKVESVAEKFRLQFQHTKWVLAASVYDLTLYSLGYLDDRQILRTVVAFTLTAVITSYYVIQLFAYGWNVLHILAEEDRAR